jgi:hypothetical protein
MKIAYSLTTVGPIPLAWFGLIFAMPSSGFWAAIKEYQVSLTRREVALFAAFDVLVLSGNAFADSFLGFALIITSIALISLSKS